MTSVLRSQPLPRGAGSVAQREPSRPGRKLSALLLSLALLLLLLAVGLVRGIG